jgi:hypothetical protein
MDEMIAEETERSAVDRWVSAGILLLAVAAVGYVIALGSNLPTNDEWDLFPRVLVDRFPAGWLIEHHNEHRYPLGKLLWVVGLQATGFDFRTGMFTTVAILTAASFLFTSAVRRLRGSARVADLVIPALLLNAGHWYNLLMGYQIVFALVVLGLAGVTWAATRLPRSQSVRPAIVGGLSAWIIGQSGGFGLAATPALVIWLFWVAIRRAIDPTPGRWRQTGVILLFPIGLLAYSGWVATTTPRLGSLSGSAPLDVVTATVGFLEIGWGTCVIDLAGRAQLVGGVFAVAAYSLAGWSTLRALRDVERASAAIEIGLILLAVGSMAVAIALARGFGLCERFVTVSAAGLCVCWVAIAGFGPTIPFSPRIGAVLGQLAAILIVGMNVATGLQYAQIHRAVAKSFQADIRGGMPPIFLAGKYGGIMPFLIGDRLGERIARLRDRKVGIFRDAGVDPSFEVVPAKGMSTFQIQCSVEPFLPGGVPPQFPLPSPGRSVVGLRLMVEQHHAMGYQQLRIRWRSRGSDGSERTATATPTSIPGRSGVVFRIDDDPVDLRLEPACPILGLTVESAEWLVLSNPQHP